MVAKLECKTCIRFADIFAKVMRVIRRMKRKLIDKT